MSTLANTATAATPLKRDEYGQLASTTSIDTQLNSAYALVTSAAEKGKRPRKFESMGFEKVSSRIGRKLIGTAVTKLFTVF